MFGFNVRINGSVVEYACACVRLPTDVAVRACELERARARGGGA